MANEYAVNQSDLVQVADAIRTKGETSGQLVFPSGFVNAIQQITTGAELNYTVRSYASGNQVPATAEENTIVLLTSTTITSHVFSADEPTAENGKVWFRTGASSPVAFAPFKGNPIMVYPVECYQYVNRNWEEKYAGIYMGNQWKFFQDFLFNNGDTCNWITGGWTSEGAVSLFDFPVGNARIGTTLGVSVQSTANYNICGIISTVNKIDFSNIEQIRVKGMISGYSNLAACVLFISTERGNAKTNVAFWSVSSKNGQFEFIQDVSGYDGQYYVGLSTDQQSIGGMNTTSMQVSEIEVTKNWE